MNSNSLKIALISGLLFILVGCAGKTKLENEKTAAEGQTRVDLTRPPVTIKGTESVKESNPDETISFEKWKKDREPGEPGEADEPDE